MSEEIQQLAQLIEDAKRVVVFTGAGISTESGIPDFRSPTGIWSQTTPIYFDEYVASAEARVEAWRRKFEIDKDMIEKVCTPREIFIMANWRMIIRKKRRKTNRRGQK